MPIVYKEEDGASTLLLWRIDETPEQLYAQAAPADRLSCVRFTDEARRCEHLAWRAALRTVLPGAEVEYDGNGAPRIVGGNVFVSASHTRGIAAVLLSDKKCAVDIEDTGRELSGVSRRYLSEHEALLPESHRDGFNTAVWGAKEALYKYSGRRGLDFRKDIAITTTDLDGGLMRGCITQADETDIRLLHWESYLVAYIL